MKKTFEDDKNLAIKLSRELIVINEPLNNIKSCMFSSDGTKIIAQLWDMHDIKISDIKIFDAVTGNRINTLIGPHNTEVYTYCLSPNGLQLIVYYGNDFVKIWDTTIWQCIKIIVEEDVCIALSCCFSPDNLLIVTGYFNGIIRITCALTGRLIKIMNGHHGNILSCNFSPDGSFIISGSSDKTIKIWNVSTGKCIKILEDHKDRVRECKFSPDGSKIISCSDDGTIKLWCALTYKPLISWGGNCAVFSCDFSKDGYHIIFVSQDVVIINIITGKYFIFDDAKDCYSIRNSKFSPDMSQIVYSTYNEIIIRNFPLGVDCNLLS